MPGRSSRPRTAEEGKGERALRCRSGSRLGTQRAGRGGGHSAPSRTSAQGRVSRPARPPGLHPAWLPCSASRPRHWEAAPDFPSPLRLSPPALPDGQTFDFNVFLPSTRAERRVKKCNYPADPPPAAPGATPHQKA